MASLPGYTYGKKLGSGQFGEVFEATEDLTGERCAIKHIDKSKLLGTMAAWKREAEAMAACHSPHLVRIRHAVPTPDGPVLVMDYLPGGTASAKWSGAPAPVRLVVQTMIDVCWGLHHVHTTGLVHQDVKPGNVLFDANGVGVLGDMGLASKTSGGGGVPIFYMPHTPPELLGGGGWTAEADVYATGVTTYRLLVGDTALAPRVAALMAQGKWPPTHEWPPHVHSRLRRTIRAATNRDPSKRPASAADLRDLLTKALPLVSWQESGTNGWTGNGEDRVWSVMIQQTKSGWLLECQCAIAAGPFRHVKKACEKFSKEPEAVKAASVLMDELATRADLTRFDGF